ncbi:hypothetical protein AY601_5015 [Pedobacter cryoconitis]|uniref:Uncharacterized protein n=1 Tax=Pedobacter cryoconitis TaxID=188932 RepID=A0A127VKX0_9SPHI|nr:hypothetical protein AY601_5015 [Pedobacter cryoconitis]
MQNFILNYNLFYTLYFFSFIFILLLTVCKAKTKLYLYKANLKHNKMQGLFKAQINVIINLIILLILQESKAL